MALVLKGQEFVTTEALNARLLSSLAALAQRRPLILNGITMCARDLMRLAEEARQSKSSIWPVAPTCAECDPSRA
jgi:hypothetical protein